MCLTLRHSVRLSLRYWLRLRLRRRFRRDIGRHRDGQTVFDVEHLITYRTYGEVGRVYRQSAVVHFAISQPGCAFRDIQPVSFTVGRASTANRDYPGDTSPGGAAANSYSWR